VVVDVDTSGAPPAEYGSFSFADVDGGAPFSYVINGLVAGTSYFVRVSPNNDRCVGLSVFSLSLSLSFSLCHSAALPTLRRV
jgi:hypothetical protein